MASSQKYVLGVLVLAIIQLKAIASSHEHLQDLKFLNFTLFQHDLTLGIEGGPDVFAYLGRLTVEANKSSEQVGFAEGTRVLSSPTGRSISVAILTLSLKDHKGSLSVVGIVDIVDSTNLPVVGGTKDFLFVQGYVTSSPLNPYDPNVVYEIQFHLYWPPYATPSS
ncbi:uncharacterized protein LOC106767838 [Vigna radiata var. radiata]|uniref:Dirigent protein n=1 Tax=Vigna radiata var. radiata TaxID=3916 RepID=A0A1S3UQC1_VIGRR|nr:uncharacterized protein LOC106767838 [Vigna radiata var. radiata]